MTVCPRRDRVHWLGRRLLSPAGIVATAEITGGAPGDVSLVAAVTGGQVARKFWEDNDLQVIVESGRIADIALAVVVLEGLAMIFLKRLSGRGPGLLPVLPFLLAGACLLLAWRTAAAGLPWPLPSGLLAAAGIAHLVDFFRRRP